MALFRCRTANPKLVQRHKLDNKFSSDESSASSSPASSPPPPPAPSPTCSSNSMLVGLDSMGCSLPSSSMSVGTPDANATQRQQFSAVESCGSGVVTAAPTKKGGGGGRHHASGVGAMAQSTSQLYVQQPMHSMGASTSDYLTTADPKNLLQDIKAGEHFLLGTAEGKAPDEHMSLKTTSSSLAALSPNSLSASTSAMYATDLLPKIFEGPTCSSVPPPPLSVTPSIATVAADIASDPSLDISLANAALLSNAVVAAAAANSPRLRQQSGDPSLLRMTPSSSATPDIRLIQELQPPPPPPPPVLAASPNSTSMRLFDDQSATAVSSGIGQTSVRIIATTDPTIPVRLVPDLAQSAKETQPQQSNLHQQVRILPNSRIVSASSPTTAEPVQLMPEGQILESFAAPAAAPVVTGQQPPVIVSQHPPPASSSRTILVSGVEPIYVPSTASTENKFVSAAAAAAAFLPPMHHIMGRKQTRSQQQQLQQPQQLVTVVSSDPSLLDHPKAEPPPPAASATTTLVIKPVYAQDGAATCVVAPSAPTPQARLSAPVAPCPQINEAPTAISKQGTRKEKAGQAKKMSSISCFKCNVCGFLGLTAKAVEDHMLLEHDAELTDDEDNDQWLSVAQKEGIKLECPFCPNTFNAEGSRSFRVHVIDDHGVNDAEADKQFKEQYSKRKASTMEFLKKKREEEREERRRSRKDGLEAYVDDQGELRVRNTRRKRPPTKPEKTVPPKRARELDVDVSVKEYVAAIDVAKKLEKAKRTGEEPREKPDEKQKILIDLSQRHKRKQQAGAFDDDDDSSSSGEEAGDIDIVNVPSANPDVATDYEEDHMAKPQQPAQAKKRVGRPKGSRSIGLTKLKRTNPNINLSEEEMGSECGVDGCAVRLKQEDNLAYHRRCHVPNTGEPVGGKKSKHLACPECGERFAMWSPLAMHLWRVHRVDMELHACPQCQDFKSYYLTTLSMHKQTHQTERPYLCDDCGKKFKTDKSLRVHQRAKCGREDQEQGGEGAAASTATVPEKLQKCDVCQRDFKNMRRLRDHIASVHEKRRPHLCNYCGYSGR